MKTSVNVLYKHVEGWHVFYSDDLPGLYVTSQNPKIAFEDVAPSIAKLIELDEKIKVRVEVELTFWRY